MYRSVQQLTLKEKDKWFYGALQLLIRSYSLN